MTVTSGLIEDLGFRLWSSSRFWDQLSILERLARFYESPAVQRRRKSKAARRRKRTS